MDAVPVFPPEQEPDELVLPVIGAGWVMVTEPFALHPLLSVTVKLGEPAQEEMELVVTPEDHKYLNGGEPPLRLRLADPLHKPLHVTSVTEVDRLPVNGVTTTVVVAVAEQLPLVSFTVYVVLVVGLTIILVPVAPVFQVYVPPPDELAVKVEDRPVHITLGDAATLKVKLGVTVIGIESFTLQPPLLPVTV
jgi:hypothetical protein